MTLQLASAAVRDCLRGGGPPDDAAFNTLALQVHDAQCEAIPALRQLAIRRGRGPGQVDHWSQLPAVPAAAYKRYDLFGGSDPVVRTFTSSGTSGPHVSRALYSETGLELMDLAISRNARRMLFPDGLATRILVLAPSPLHAPGMIMAYGMQQLILEFGAPGSRFLIQPGSFDLPAIQLELTQAIDDAVPVTLIGASFGFVHLIDDLMRQGLRLRLPPGSRTLDAGGFKGRSREVTPAAMRQAIADWMGVEPPRSINLLGLTELPSQLYDDGWASMLEARTPLRGKRVPPWMRVGVVDPETLEACPPGRPGLLTWVDLANVERPLGLLSDDMGMLEPDGSFHILGRAAGAEARGCSLSLEEWARAQAEAAREQENPTPPEPAEEEQGAARAQDDAARPLQEDRP